MHRRFEPQILTPYRDLQSNIQDCRHSWTVLAVLILGLLGAATFFGGH